MRFKNRKDRIKMRNRCTHPYKREKQKYRFCKRELTKHDPKIIPSKTVDLDGFGQYLEDHCRYESTIFMCYFCKSNSTRDTKKCNEENCSRSFHECCYKSTTGTCSIHFCNNCEKKSCCSCRYCEVAFCEDHNQNGYHKEFTCEKCKELVNLNEKQIFTVL